MPFVNELVPLGCRTLCSNYLPCLAFDLQTISFKTAEIRDWFRPCLGTAGVISLQLAGQSPGDGFCLGNAIALNLPEPGVRPLYGSPDTARDTASAPLTAVVTAITAHS